MAPFGETFDTASTTVRSRRTEFMVAFREAMSAASIVTIVEDFEALILVALLALRSEPTSLFEAMGRVMIAENFGFAKGFT